MGRPASDATLLRSAKRTIRDLEREVRFLRDEKMALQTRANKAEAERNQWERRFDELLARQQVTQEVKHE